MTHPGPRPIYGDTVALQADDEDMVITGAIVVQGGHRDGRGHVDLTLPDLDPMQRTVLESASQLYFELHHGGERLYRSPELQITGVRPDGETGLVLTARP